MHPSARMTSAARMTATLRALAQVIETGEAMLFTGAGFSADARDLDGDPLPDSAQMIHELWPLVFDGEAPDDSSLQDLYDVALMRAPERLGAYVARRLRIGDAALPAHYRTWFSAPWRRIYTLNVDDLEVAVQRQFALPRALRSLSALADGDASGQPGAVDVIHLNGMAGTNARELTFSTMQYAARLCGSDHPYERLVSDLQTAPFVFAGTTLDEVILWQHLELHRRNYRDSPRRPPSFLISPSLSRARQVLLESLEIRWVCARIEDIALPLPG